MNKTKTSITIDPYMLDLAQKNGINVSACAEEGIKKKLNPENAVDDIGLTCEYCGMAMPHATVRDQNGLMWCLPDEKWVCPSCLHQFTELILKSKVL